MGLSREQVHPVADKYGMKSNLARDGETRPNIPLANLQSERLATPAHAVVALFDVDGVIADTAKLHTAAWARLAAEEELPFEYAVQQALRGLPREDSLRTILGERSVTPDKFEEMLERKNKYYLAGIETLDSTDILPGVDQIIADFRDARVEVAAVSASKNAKAVIDRLGISKKFRMCVDGIDQVEDEAGRDRFRIAADTFGAKYDHCIVFEDATSAIHYASDLGMKTVALGEVARNSGADLAFESLQGVCAKLILKWLNLSPFGSAPHENHSIQMVARN